MRCPFCAHSEDKVVDSRESKEGGAIRRRRECLACGRRFTSYERVEEFPLLVVKKDGRRESFDRNKLLRGLSIACQKRPVSLEKLEETAGDIQARLLERPDREVPSRELGELVMDALKHLDSVAYVRFASVYRDFKDLPDFVRALEEALMHRDSKPDAYAEMPPKPQTRSLSAGQELPLFPSEDTPPRRIKSK